HTRFSRDWSSDVCSSDLGVIAGIKRLAALRDLVERRHGHIEMPAANKLRQLPVEEGDEKRGDMRAVHIGVGHDDDLVIAQIFFRSEERRGREGGVTEGWA